MKRFFSWLKGLILRHKLLTIICFMAFVIIVFMLYIFFSLFIGGNDIYGDRLKGIEKVEISKKELSEVSKKLEGKDEVVKASTRIQGKIIYINIKYKDSVSVARAKEIAVSALEDFEKDEKSFYDIGFYLTQDKEDKSGFKITGNKNAKLDSVSWIKS